MPKKGVSDIFKLKINLKSFLTSETKAYSELLHIIQAGAFPPVLRLQVALKVDLQRNGPYGHTFIDISKL